MQGYQLTNQLINKTKQNKQVVEVSVFFSSMLLAHYSSTQGSDIG